MRMLLFQDFFQLKIGGIIVNFGSLRYQNQKTELPPIMPTIEHPAGNYEFLPGIAPYSCGVVASSGYEIVHVRYLRPINYRPGLDRIAAYLENAGRPRAALCSIELRSPKPFSFAGFGELNADYASILKSWGIFVNGINPVARTNVAPEGHAPDSVVIYGFSYTRQAQLNVSQKTFVVAGGGELPEGKLDAESIVERGDLSSDGLVKKARFVMGLMENRLLGLGAGWGDVTATNIYTVHSMDRIIPEVLAPISGPASLQGYQWYFTRPPIVEIEYEMDLRGYANQLIIAD
jgi:hypothetical protein